MSISRSGSKGNSEDGKKLASPWVQTGTMIITYCGDMPLSHVRLVGACGQTCDEFWAPAADCRPLLAKIVRVRRGQKR